MTAAIGASAAILLALAASAQDPAATNPTTDAVATQPVRDTRPTTDAEPPKVDPKLLIDVINMLTRPRPAPPPGATAPALAEPAAAPPAPMSVPTPSRPAAIAVAPAPRTPPAAVVPRGAATAPAPAPRPAPIATAPPLPAAADEPLPADVAPPALPPVVTVNAQPVPPEPASSQPILEPAKAFPGSWWLLGLIAAAAIAAAWIRVQRARRIARTRAALSLEPRLEMSAGAGSTKGLALAGPPVAIRARLDWGGAP